MSFIFGPLDLGQVHPPELSPSRHVPELVADFIHPRETDVDPQGTEFDWYKVSTNIIPCPA